MFTALFACYAFLLGASPACAEVMDKVPTGVDLWAASLMWGAVCFVAGRIQPWLGLLVLILSLPGAS